MHIEAISQLQIQENPIHVIGQCAFPPPCIRSREKVNHQATTSLMSTPLTSIPRQQLWARFTRKPNHHLQHVLRHVRHDATPPIPVHLGQSLPILLVLFKLCQHHHGVLSIHDRAPRSQPTLHSSKLLVHDRATLPIPVNGIPILHQQTQRQDRLHWLQGQEGVKVRVLVQSCTSMGKLHRHRLQPPSLLLSCHSQWVSSSTIQ